MDIVNLNSFLKLGYFIDYRCDKYQLDFSGIDRSKYKDCSEIDLIKLGKDKLFEAVASDFKVNQTHVVPLSGGLDSRAILAVLMEFTPASSIKTYTFGTPGTLDFEIGNLVAKISGTKHTVFPLTEYRFTQEELLDISQRVDRQTVLFHHAPVWELDKLYKGCQFWSGYIGDAITGGHIPHSPSVDINEMKLRYLHKFSFVKSIRLTNLKDDAFLDRIDFKWIGDSALSLDELLLYQERCQKLTAPHVLINGFEYKTPFINNTFMDFMLSLEDCYRRNQYLYKEILLNISPRLFSLKTKNNYGLPIKANFLETTIYRVINKTKRILCRLSPIFTDPNINYLDFDNSIRKNQALKETIYANICDLKERHIVDWINIDDIWNSHLSQKHNHSDALLVLASLEINLKSLKNSDDIILQ